jgi:hypothetical protein
MVSRRDAVKLVIAGASFPRIAAAAEPVAPLSQLGYHQTTFADGPLRTQVQENHRLLLGLNDDSLLLPFRIRERKPLAGQELGGWYSTYSTAPACTFGQWVSGLCRFYAITGDPATRAKVERLLREWSATISPEGWFYDNYKFPAYMYDKLVCMLLDAATLTGQAGVRGMLARCTVAAEPHLPPHAIEMRKVVHSSDYTEHALDESYTLPENLFLAAKWAGDPHYRQLAERFLFDKEFFDPLSRSENVLPNLHAYSHVNALSSAAMAYLTLGDEKYLQAARNGFRFVQEQSFVTGGWGPHEHFIAPGSGALARSLTNMHSGFETPCGSYAHIKLCRYLLRMTGDPRYGDSMERVLYNTVLGAKPIADNGDAFYYSDYTPQTKKRVFYAKWPCCSGTLPQVVADYHVSAYFQSRKGVYVNLYVSSTLRCKMGANAVTLRQVTEYPYSDDVRLEIHCGVPVEFSLFLRVPEWAEGASLSVIGQRDFPTLTPGTFAEVRRMWRSGDTVELHLPRASRLEAVDAQTPQTVGLVQGPLALLRIDDAPPVPQTGRKWILAAAPVAAPPAAVERKALLGARQLSPGAHEWSAEGLRFKPFCDIKDETYTTYQQVLD